MFAPVLGISLNRICEKITEETISELNGSKIRRLEMHPCLFGEKADYTPEEFVGKLRGIKVNSLHFPYGRGYDFSSKSSDELEHAFKAFSGIAGLAEKLEAPVIIAHSGIEPIAKAERETRLSIARESLKRISDICAAKNKKLAIELLPRSCIGNHESELLSLIEGLDQKVTGICLDTNHMMARPQDLPGLVRKLGSKLFALHMSDYDGVDEQHLLPGKGVIDWKAFLASLKAIDYPSSLTFECVVPELPFPQKLREVEKAYEWLLSLIQK